MKAKEEKEEREVDGKAARDKLLAPLSTLHAPTRTSARDRDEILLNDISINLFSVHRRAKGSIPQHGLSRPSTIDPLPSLTLSSAILLSITFSSTGTSRPPRVKRIVYFVKRNLVTSLLIAPDIRVTLKGVAGLSACLWRVVHHLRVSWSI